MMLRRTVRLTAVSTLTMSLLIVTTTVVAAAAAITTTATRSRRCFIKTLSMCTNCTNLCLNPNCNAGCDEKGNVVSLNIINSKYKIIPKAVGKLPYLNYL